MADRIDARVKAVEVAGIEPSRESCRAETELQELAAGDDTVLTPRQLRDRLRQWGVFLSYMRGK